MRSSVDLSSLSLSDFPGYLINCSETELLEASTWLLSELIRKTNDERVLAVQVQSLRDQLRGVRDAVSITSDSLQKLAVPFGYSIPDNQERSIHRFQVKSRTWHLCPNGLSDLMTGDLFRMFEPDGKVVLHGDDCEWIVKRTAYVPIGETVARVDAESIR